MSMMFHDPIVGLIENVSMFEQALICYSIPKYILQGIESTFSKQYPKSWKLSHESHWQNCF